VDKCILVFAAMSAREPYLQPCRKQDISICSHSLYYMPTMGTYLQKASF
jgi:hypothetical protein